GGSSRCATRSAGRRRCPRPWWCSRRGRRGFYTGCGAAASRTPARGRGCLCSPFFRRAASWAARARRGGAAGGGASFVPVLLWGPALLGGRLSLSEVFAAAAAGVLLWALYFALGFRAFARGAQANGLGMLLTVGLPLATFALTRLGWPTVAAWLPPGMVYQAGTAKASLLWLIGPVAVAALTLVLPPRCLAECDSRLPPQ